MLTGNLSLDLISGGLSSPYWWLFNTIWALTWGTLLFGLSLALLDSAGIKWWTLFLAIALVPTYFFYFQITRRANITGRPTYLPANSDTSSY